MTNYKIGRYAHKPGGYDTSIEPDDRTATRLPSWILYTRGLERPHLMVRITVLYGESRTPTEVLVHDGCEEHRAFQHGIIPTMDSGARTTPTG